LFPSAPTVNSLRDARTPAACVAECVRPSSANAAPDAPHGRPARRSKRTEAADGFSVNDAIAERQVLADLYRQNKNDVRGIALFDTLGQRVLRKQQK
jgi:hypothetical protein